MGNNGKELHILTSPEAPTEGRTYELRSSDPEAMQQWYSLLQAAANPEKPSAQQTDQSGISDQTWRGWNDDFDSEGKRELRMLVLRATLRLDAAYCQAIAC